jgi:hypothetical protein
MDGDTVGECSTMTAEIRPGALRLRIPQDSALAAAPYQGQAAEAALASTNGAHGPQAAPAGSSNGAGTRRPVAARLRRRGVSP